MNKQKIKHYIFIDESGDPGPLFKEDEKGKKIVTGASAYYILSAVCVDSKNLFIIQNRILEIRNKYKYRSEIKSNSIPLLMYKYLLKIINEFEIPTFYRFIDKNQYKGVFAVNGNKKLKNVFDNYNLVKLCTFSVNKCGLEDVEVIIDRTDRRLLNGDFESFNRYLKSKVNTKMIEKISHVTHVDSQYVNIMQIADLASGAIRDHVTGRNKELKKVMDKKYLFKVF